MRLIDADKLDDFIRGPFVQSYKANDRAKAWAFHFRELMKSGLMDTEESDA